jgi:hypothetical protein
LAADSQELSSQTVLMDNLVSDLVGVVKGEKAKSARKNEHRKMTSPSAKMISFRDD